MITDFIIVVVVILFTVIGALRGIARTLVNIAALALSMMLSRFLSGMIAGWIYTTFIQKTILTNLETEITKNGFSETVAHSMRSIPDWIQSVINSFFTPLGLKTDDLQKGLIVNSSQAQQLAKTVEQPLGQLITGVLSILVMAVLFFLLMMIIKLIIAMIFRCFHFSALSGINHVFGGIFGCIEGIVFICLAINAIYVIMTNASPALAENPQYFGSLFRALCAYI